jgi:hypothetical protein
MFRSSTCSILHVNPLLASILKPVMLCRGMPYMTIPDNETCSADRSTLALHYSGNLVDWTQAGLIDYTLAFHRHFTQPSMLIDGDDLLVVTEASIGGERMHPCALACDEQHESYCTALPRHTRFKSNLPTSCGC